MYVCVYVRHAAALWSCCCIYQTCVPCQSLSCTAVQAVHVRTMCVSERVRTYAYLWLVRMCTVGLILLVTVLASNEMATAHNTHQ